MNPIKTNIIMYIASPINPAIIIELTIKISIKVLFDMLNLADKNDINITEANAIIDGCPKNKSKITVLISKGDM